MQAGMFVTYCSGQLLRGLGWPTAALHFFSLYLCAGAYKKGIKNSAFLKALS